MSAVKRHLSFYWELHLFLCLQHLLLSVPGQLCGWEDGVYWHVYCTSVYCLLQGAICVYSVYTCLLQVEMPTKVAGDVYFSGWCLLQGAMCVYTSRPAVDTNSKGCLLQYMGCTAVCYLPSPPDRKPPHTHQARNHHTRNHHTR